MKQLQNRKDDRGNWVVIPSKKRHFKSFKSPGRK